jgi:hypothetical protein
VLADVLFIETGQHRINTFAIVCRKPMTGSRHQRYSAMSDGLIVHGLILTSFKTGKRPQPVV